MSTIRRVLQRACAYAERSDDLVAICIAATEPNTGFGYLELGEEIEPGVLRVVRFTEKPSFEVAARVCEWLKTIPSSGFTSKRNHIA